MSAIGSPPTHSRLSASGPIPVVNNRCANGQAAPLSRVSINSAEGQESIAQTMR
jgi:hypothetical protein